MACPLVVMSCHVWMHTSDTQCCPSFSKPEIICLSHTYTWKMKCDKFRKTKIAMPGPVLLRELSFFRMINRWVAVFQFGSHPENAV